MEAGKGVSAEIGGRRVVCGNERYIDLLGIALDGDAERVAEKLKGEGKALIITVVDGKVCGVIALSDTLRDGAREAVERIRAMDTRVVLLTGDNKQAAARMAAATGIGEVRAELLPEQKVESISALRSEGRKVCMAGDGVNDAPALKVADVGVAMGAMGSDIAIEAADIALMSDDIRALPYLKRLARATVRTIRFGITLSLLINLAAIVLSLFGLLNPTTGALVHNAGSVLVVLIAALLYDRKFDK
jgi:P-type E1-E2 ATPase